MKPTAANMIPVLTFALHHPQVGTLLQQRDRNNQTYLHSFVVELLEL